MTELRDAAEAFHAPVGSVVVVRQYVLRGLTDQERQDAILRERSLFYVAATRARDELVVLWTGDQSEFVAGSASKGV